MESLDIINLKNSIESGTIGDTLLIMEYSDNSFLCYQYARKISEVRKKSIKYVDSIEEMQPQESIFGNTQDNDCIKVYSCEELILPDNYNKIKDAIIITKKSPSISGISVKMPKLESWHIKDYIYSIAEGLDSKYLDFLQLICNNDIYRIQQELDKLTMFTVDERKFLFESMLDDNAFGDLSSKTVFDFSNALITKNVKALSCIYDEIENIDISEMGLLTILLQNFKNIISVQLSKNATAESLNMKPNQFYAIKKNMNHYTGDQLIKIYQFLLGIDKKVKTGELTTNILRDYMVVNILGV